MVQGGAIVTHNLGNPRPYRAVCRELYRHEARIRQERPLEPEGRRLRPWAVVALWLVAFTLFLAMCGTFVDGW